MLRLSLSTLRARKSAFIGAFSALAFASILVTICGVLLESSLRAGTPTERYAGAPVVVAGKNSISFTSGSGEDRETESVLLPEKARLDAGLASRLRGVSEVARVVPDVSVPARLFRGDREVPATKALLAHGWESAPLTPFRLTAGRTPQGADEIVVDAGLAARGNLRPGERVTLAATDPEPREYRVVGVAAPAGQRKLVKQSAVFLSTARAGELAAGGRRVDAFGILPRSGVSTEAAADAVERALSGVDAEVYTGRDRGKAEFQDVALANEAMISMSGAFGGIAMMIAVFVVAGTFAFSVQQRNRELGLLRAIGATPRQVRRMLAGEALAIGLLAAAVGLLPGIWIAGLVGDALVDRGVVPDSFEIVAGWIPMVAAAGAAVLTSQLAVFAAGRRAGRIRPTQALTEAAVPPRRLGVVRILLGLVFAGGGVASLLASASTSGDDAAGLSASIVMCFLCAVGLLGPLLARVSLALAGPLLAGLSRLTGFLAVANGRSNARRMASVFTPIVLSVAFASTMLFMQTTQDHAAEAQGKDRGVADHVLRASPGLPDRAVDEVRALPGVRAAAGIAPTSIVTRGTVDDWPAQAVTPGRLDGLLDLDVRSGDLAGLRGRSVALSRHRADGMGVRVGERVVVWLGDGTKVRLRVVAIYDRSLGFGDYLVPREVVAGHVTNPLVDSILVRGGREADLERFAARWPGLEVLDANELRSREDEDRELNAYANYLLVGMLIVFTAIAVANTLVMSTAERVREFALLRLSGATPRQVLRMVRFEALLVAAVAAVLGSAIAAVTLAAFSAAITDSAMPYVPPLWYGAVLAAAATLALAASLVPARLALRTRPVEGIGIRE
jgi:putative ABC transport system permease protein